MLLCWELHTYASLSECLGNRSVSLFEENPINSFKVIAFPFHIDKVFPQLKFHIILWLNG